MVERTHQPADVPTVPPSKGNAQPMTANVVTTVLIVFIIAAMATFAARRVRKIMKQNQQASAAREAALLAEVAAFKNTHRGEGEPRAATRTKDREHTEPAITPDTEDAAPEPTTVKEPGSVEDDLRAFFGATSTSASHDTEVTEEASGGESSDAAGSPAGSPAVGPANESTQGTDDTTRPPVTGGAATQNAALARDARFDAAVAHLALALRQAADEVERTATGEGTIAARTAATMSAVTTAMGSLPLSALVSITDSESPSSPSA